jgi:hypothetical protein
MWTEEIFASPNNSFSRILPRKYHFCEFLRENLLHLINLSKHCASFSMIYDISLNGIKVNLVEIEFIVKPFYLFLFHNFVTFTGGHENSFDENFGNFSKNHPRRRS